MKSLQVSTNASSTFTFKKGGKKKDLEPHGYNNTPIIFWTIWLLHWGKKTQKALSIHNIIIPQQNHTID